LAFGNLFERRRKGGFAPNVVASPVPIERIVFFAIGRYGSYFYAQAGIRRKK
jgi:hypothetical protein